MAGLLLGLYWRSFIYANVVFLVVLVVAVVLLHHLDRTFLSGGVSPLRVALVGWWESLLTHPTWGGRGGRQHILTQNDPHIAVIILIKNYVGGNFLKKNSSTTVDAKKPLTGPPPKSSHSRTTVSQGGGGGARVF